MEDSENGLAIDINDLPYVVYLKGLSKKSTTMEKKEEKLALAIKAMENYKGDVDGEDPMDHLIAFAYAMRDSCTPEELNNSKAYDDLLPYASVSPSVKFEVPRDSGLSTLIFSHALEKKRITAEKKGAQAIAKKTKALFSTRSSFKF
jgi:hypothetical protein